MIKVWILILLFNQNSAHGINGPVIVDNIVSYEECLALQKRMMDTGIIISSPYGNIISRCIEVIKKD